MNAYYELFGEDVNSESLKKIPKEDYLIFEEDEDWASIAPKPDASHMKNYIKTVDWAEINYNDEIHLTLKSKRTEEDEINFLTGLIGINYDNGYGIQELYGTIVFKNGSYLQRKEYDGKEWWELCRTPREPNW